MQSFGQDNQASSGKPDGADLRPRSRLERTAIEQWATGAVVGRRVLALALVAIVVATAGAPAAAAPRRDTEAPATERTVPPSATDRDPMATAGAQVRGGRDQEPGQTPTAGAIVSVRAKGQLSGQIDRLSAEPAVAPIAKSISVPDATVPSDPTPTESSTPEPTAAPTTTTRSRGNASDEDPALPPDTAARPAPVVRTTPVAREARAAIALTPEPTARRPEPAAARQPAGLPAGAWPPRLDEPIMRWLPEIYAASAATGVPPRILAGIMRLESSGNPNVISVSGARGLMQIMPYHLENQGIPRARWHDPATNILAGATLLASFESKDWRANVGRYFGAGCDAYGTCTDVYIKVVFQWIDHYAPIVRHPYRSGLPVLPPSWRPPRIRPQVDDYPAVQAPRDTRYMPAGTTPISSSTSSPRPAPRATTVPARPASVPPTPVATDAPAVIELTPPADETPAELTATPAETPTAEPTAAPTTEPTLEAAPATTGEPVADEATTEPEATTDDESPREKVLEKREEIGAPQATEAG